MPSLDALSSAIQKLYAAAADRTLWGDAMRTVEDLTGSAGAVIDFAPTADAQPITIAGRFTHEECAEYARDYMHMCPSIRFAMQNPERNVQYDAMILSEKEMDRDPVYRWFEAHGLRYFIGSSVATTSQHRIMMSLQRSSKQGHVLKNDIALYALLLPHVRRL